MESTQQPQKAAGEATSAPILETYRYSAASMPTTEGIYYCCPTEKWVEKCRYHYIPSNQTSYLSWFD